MIVLVMLYLASIRPGAVLAILLRCLCLYLLPGVLLLALIYVLSVIEIRP
jgi:hypothetical protein